MNNPPKKVKSDFNNLCDTCKHQDCCTNSVPPLVFSHDMKVLEKIGVQGEKYFEDIRIGNEFVKTIKKKPNSNQCIFWDTEAIQCSIYKDRPFDCKVYPFDILKVHGVFHWIVYSCNPDSDWGWTDNYLQFLEKEPQFNEVMKKISIYHDYTETLMKIQNDKKIPYVILRQVKFDSIK